MAASQHDHIIWGQNLKTNSKEGRISPGVVFYFFQENFKYKKLLCVKLLVSCELSNLTPASFWHFTREFDYCSTMVEPTTPR